MKVEIWLTGKTKEPWADQGMEAYLKRCRKYGSVEIVVIPDSRQTQPDAIRRDESARILTQLGKQQRAHNILLDETGRQLSSAEMASHLSQLYTRGHGMIRFIIGGAYGVDESVKGAADEMLSLSSMTFPHQLVRLIFAEQLYRAFTILRGEGYHH